jgi:hypothetical protein
MAEWFTCDVTSTGPAEDGTIYIRLRPIESQFTERWFKAHPTIRKEQLAVALSSMSMRSRVSAAVSATTEYSVVERLYLQRPV